MFTALNQDDNNKIHISEITRENTGQACNCICLYCGQPVEALKKKTYPYFTERFRHISGTECFNSVIHETAVYIIVNNDSIYLPSGQNQKYDNPQREYRISGSDYRADVMVLTDNTDIAIEIKVWHDCESDKVKFYKEQSFRSFKISLNPKKYLTPGGELSEDQKSVLMNDVLNRSDNREWYKNIDPVTDEVSKTQVGLKARNSIFMTILKSFVVVYLLSQLYSFLKGKSLKRNIRKKYRMKKG